MSQLSKPYFHNEKAAFKHLESLLWPDGPVCPHCGNCDRVYELKGKTTRAGLKKCGECRKQFTVRVGTVFESSHIPLHKWLQAAYLMCSSKKGMSAHQLHRILQVTYKSAWFMAHRLREAMKDGSIPPMGGPGEAVQADETYFGQKEGPLPKKTTSGRPFIKGGAKRAHKRAVVSLVSNGKARTFHVDRADAETIRHILVTNVRRETELHTDESRLYTKVGKEYAAHKTVNHSRGEYVRDGVHTNNVENYFSIFKRGMKGIYQHCSEKHLHRYLAEFDLRYNNREIEDIERAEIALKGASGKRLTYKISGQEAQAA